MTFSEGYEGYLVKFKVKRGPLDELREIGVTDGNPLVERKFEKMSTAKDIGGNWNQTRTRFKVETLRNSNTKQINIALGKRDGLNQFNNIIELQLIKIIKK